MVVPSKPVLAVGLVVTFLASEAHVWGSKVEAAKKMVLVSLLGRLSRPLVLL